MKFPLRVAVEGGELVLSRLMWVMLDSIARGASYLRTSAGDTVVGRVAPPMGATRWPKAVTLDALERRGLVELRPSRELHYFAPYREWTTTTLGRAVVAEVGRR